MNLQPLYDLKERLEYAAIAGTGLMQEDFRLRRAVEAMTSLAGVNPVFAKISTAAKALLNGPKEERSTRLLDVLSLVDAVVYTQGVSNIPGEITPIQPGSGSYEEVSYGQLQPLLLALSGSGSGRMPLIQNCYAEHPAYFSDFRVLPHVVKALGDNYAELAEFIAAILIKQGTAIIPLLKEGFDPAGKTEMVRRVRLVAKLAGVGENDWFVHILPECKKDVREAVIQALAMSRDNGQLLMDLCQSEKGKLKEAALRSLSMMEDPVCMDFLRKEIRKKPAHVGFLKGVGSAIAADLAADAMQKLLEVFLEDNRVYNQSELDAIVKLASVITGKYSPRMAELWHWISGHMEALAAIVPDKNVRDSDLSVAQLLQKTLMHTVLWNTCPEILDLARILAADNREWFLCCEFLADMAVLSSAQLYEKYGPLIVRSGVLRPESKAERNERVQLMRALTAVNWSEEFKFYCVTFVRYDVLTGLPVTSCRKLDGFDERWVTLLADPKVSDDGGVYYLGGADPGRYLAYAKRTLLGRWIDQSNPRICTAVGNWYHSYTLETGRINESLYPLICCGWTNWKGLLAHCARKKGEISWNMMMTVLRSISISNAEKAAEMRQMDELAMSKKLKIQFNFWPREVVLQNIASLEADANAEL